MLYPSISIHFHCIISHVFTKIFSTSNFFFCQVYFPRYSKLAQLREFCLSEYGSSISLHIHCIPLYIPCFSVVLRCFFHGHVFGWTFWPSGVATGTDLRTLAATWGCRGKEMMCRACANCSAPQRRRRVGWKELSQFSNYISYKNVGLY